MSSSSGASTSGAVAQASAAQQEFGTLWIQDQNGVSQMIRVLQATPTKVSVAGGGGAAPAPVVSGTSAVTSGQPGVVRAIIKTAVPAPAAAAATSSSSAPPAGAAPVMRRTVQIQQGSLQGAVIARPGNRAVLGTGNRILTISPQRTTTIQQNSVGGSPVRRTVLTRRIPMTPKRRVLPSGPPEPAAAASSTSAPSPLASSPALVAALTGQPQPLIIRPGTPQQPPPSQQNTQQPQLAPVRPAFISAILDHSGTRKRQTEQDLWPESKRGRRTEKSSKGLRHFSMKVCEKVRTKGTTTYNEVADELVAEFTEQSCDSPSEQQCDQKNIRRRVYDALNVLMAMNIISKEKKEIKWLGLPTNSLQECRNLEREKAMRMQRINVKTQQLKDLILQQIAFKNLVERNRKAEEEHGPPPSNSTVQLPFIIVNTNKKTVIDCSISNDKMEYLFSFDGTFEIHDDIEVLKRMGLALGLEDGTCRPEDVERAKAMVPPSLAPYIEQLARDGAGGELEAELETALHSGTATNSDRGGSITPSIDFDTDDDDEGLLEVDDDEEDD